MPIYWFKQLDTKVDKFDPKRNRCFFPMKKVVSEKLFPLEDNLVSLTVEYGASRRVVVGGPYRQNGADRKRVTIW